MKHIKNISIILFTFVLLGCGRNDIQRNSPILSRTFMNDSWERFDYVTNELEIKEETTFNLSMDISFTEAYRYNDFSMVFSIFDPYGNPYRGKAYKFTLKDSDGNWNSELVNGHYNFTLPINKELTIVDPGKYTFQVEYRMPITPLQGISELKINNNK